MAESPRKPIRAMQYYKRPTNRQKLFNQGFINSDLVTYMSIQTKFQVKVCLPVS